MSKQNNKVTVVKGICTWTQEGAGKCQTECGHTYFPYVKDFPQPKIPEVNGIDICPWCNKEIEYKADEDEEED